jgi:uncharacterized protein YoxC
MKKLEEATTGMQTLTTKVKGLTTTVGELSTKVNGLTTKVEKLFTKVKSRSARSSILQSPFPSLPPSLWSLPRM